MGVEAIEIATFIEVYNDTEGYPSIADAAKSLGISVKTVRNKAGFYGPWQRMTRKRQSSFFAV